MNYLILNNYDDYCVTSATLIVGNGAVMDAPELNKMCRSCHYDISYIRFKCENYAPITILYYENEELKAVERIEGIHQITIDKKVGEKLLNLVDKEPWKIVKENKYVPK